MDTETPSIKFTELGLLPFVLAVSVCFFITMDMGSVVFNSIVIPFVLFECHQLLWLSWQRRRAGGTTAGSGGGGGLLGAALLLCGVRQHVMSRYIAAATAVRTLGSDFAVYLVTVVLWQLTLGLPLREQDHTEQDYLYHSSSSNEILAEDF